MVVDFWLQHAADVTNMAVLDWPLYRSFGIKSELEFKTITYNETNEWLIECIWKSVQAVIAKNESFFLRE